jgi:hypothetical protein
MAVNSLPCHAMVRACDRLRLRWAYGGGVWSGLRLASGHYGARFAPPAAPPPVRRGPRGRDAEGAHEPRHRPRKSPFNLIFVLLVLTLVVGVIAIGIIASHQEPPSFNELKAKLGIPPDVQEGNFKLQQVDFMNRLGDPVGTASDAGSLYYSYSIKGGGVAVIELDRGGWEVGEARIKRIYTR